MRTKLSDKISFLIAGGLIATLLAACGRATAARPSTPDTAANIAYVAQLDQTVTSGDFSIEQTVSQITVDPIAVGQMKIGSTDLGKIEFSGSAVIEKKSYDFDLKGEIGADGMAILQPADKTLPLRARVFCLDSGDQNARPCDQYFVDVYFRKSEGNYLHVQLVRHSDFNTTTQVAPASPPVAQPVTPVTPETHPLTPPVAPVVASAPSAPSAAAASAPSKTAPAKPAKPAKPKKPAKSASAPKAPAVSAPKSPAVPAALAVPKGLAPSTLKVPAKPVAPITAPAPLPGPVAAAPVVVSAHPQIPKRVIPRPLLPSRPSVAKSSADADTGIAVASEDIEADDAPAPNGAYVGLQDKDKIEELFSGTAASGEASVIAPDMDSEKAGRPTDQAVGTYDHGHLERASALETDAATYFIPAVNLKRYFGAYVTIRFIENFASLVMSKLPGFKLRIDDIAAKSGGPLCLSSGAKTRSGACVVAHRSHEIGLDADIGYLMDVPYTSVPQAVAGGHLSAHVRKPLQWDMFKIIYKSKLVSTVFVDAAVKRGFCAYAKSIGESQTDIAVGTLTMLRPLESHQTHFHLRFMCTKFNPRCRDDVVTGRPEGC